MAAGWSTPAIPTDAAAWSADHRRPTWRSRCSPRPGGRPWPARRGGMPTARCSSWATRPTRCRPRARRGSARRRPTCTTWPGSWPPSWTGGRGGACSPCTRSSGSRWGAARSSRPATPGGVPEPGRHAVRGPHAAADRHGLRLRLRRGGRRKPRPRRGRRLHAHRLSRSPRAPPVARRRAVMFDLLAAISPCSPHRTGRRGAPRCPEGSRRTPSTTLSGPRSTASRRAARRWRARTGTWPGVRATCPARPPAVRRPAPRLTRGGAAVGCRAGYGPQGGVPVRRASPLVDAAGTGAAGS